jgi:hypothetical protein
MTARRLSTAEDRRLEAVGLELLALPIVVLLLVAIGDALTGNGRPSVHLLQLAPFVPVLLLAWRFPHAVGSALVMVGTAGAIAYLATIALPPAPAIASAVAAFLPPVLAGRLLVRATRRRS